MFSRTKTDSKAAEQTMSKPPAAASKPIMPTEPSGAPSIISAGVEIVGNIVSPGEVQLDGAIEGDIRCHSFVLGESGRVDGQVIAENMTLRGTVEGEVRGTGVRLEKSAKVVGEITHGTLSVEAGAQISGRIHHSEHATADKPAQLAKPQAVESKPEPKSEAKADAPVAAKTNGKAEPIAASA